LAYEAHMGSFIYTLMMEIDVLLGG
jgi:hypothetical protein